MSTICLSSMLEIENCVIYVSCVWDKGTHPLSEMILSTEGWTWFCSEEFSTRHRIPLANVESEPHQHN